MKKAKITKEDVKFCKYAVMFKGDEQINDYAVAMFSDPHEAEEYIKERYPDFMTSNGDIYIAKTTLTCASTKQK